MDWTHLILFIHSYAFFKIQYTICICIWLLDYGQLYLYYYNYILIALSLSLTLNQQLFEVKWTIMPSFSLGLVFSVQSVHNIVAQEVIGYQDILLSADTGASQLVSCLSSLAEPVDQMCLLCNKSTAVIRYSTDDTSWSDTTIYN